MTLKDSFIRSRAVTTRQFRATGLWRHPDTLLLAVLVCSTPVRGTLADVCSVPTFAAARSFSVGGYTVSVAVGDFNGDGKPDLAVVNQGSPGLTYTDSTISILLGKGDGTFQHAVDYVVGAVASSVAVGDFKGDSRLDLAVVNDGSDYHSGNGRVSVLLGKGDGAFQTAVHYTTVAYPASVAVGDFDGNGIPDLAVGGADGISVLLGKGDGTFAARGNYDAPSNSVAVGDFNGDGIPDLVAVGSSALYVGTVSVLLGKGNGTFQTMVNNYGAGGDPISVTVGDFDGDGIPDLAVGNGGFSRLLSLHLGKGNGTFQPVTLDVRAGAAAVGDFNGDGKLDLAVACFGEYDQGTSSYTNNGLSVLLGKGDGAFQAAVDYKVGASPRLVTAGDFNGDGKLDLAVANQGSPGFSYADSSIAVLLGKGDGTFQAAANYPAETGVISMAVDDFNGDGKPDLAAANGGLSVLFGKGDGTFRSAVNYEAPTGASLVIVADFNGDGKPDLAAASDSSVSVLLGGGGGNFQAAVISHNTIRQPSSLAVGDVDGDGKPDLIVVGVEGISILLGKGDGTFVDAVSYPGRGIGSVAVGDFNGDNRLDFVEINNAIDLDVEAAVWLNTSCATHPHLTVVRSGAALTVSWPFPSAGYVLESATSFDPIKWKPTDTLPVNKNGRLEFTTPAAQRQGYFRLRIR
jgi:hypothetical protein